jgi:YHS domain-containing protein
MIVRYPSVCSLIAALVLFSCVVRANAQNASPGPQTVIPLEGLDPVMLTQGKEVQGEMKYKVKRGQFEYLFASAENQATFEKDPTRYEIQLDGNCARMGAPTTGNPDLYLVHNNRIYIFGSEECQTLFKAAPEKYLEVPPPPKSPPTNEMIKRGQELIAKAVDALGGGSKLDHLVSFQRKDLRADQIKNNLLLTFPDGMRQEIVRPTFTLVSVVTPSESFFLVNNSAQPMSEAGRSSIHKELNRELIVLLRARMQPEFKAWSTGSDTVGETAVERVDVQLPGFTTTLAIDPSTGRVLSQTYRGRALGGVFGEIVIMYSDFRTVEGLSLPFKATATLGGQPVPALSTTAEAVTINGPVDPTTFKKPKSPSSN